MHDGDDSDGDGMPLPVPGDLVGKHRIESVIGEGGFGRVYLATAVDTDRPVAIKVLKPGKDGYDPKAVARFQRELRTIAKLQSPHTLTLYDYGSTDDGVLFMITEFVEGEDLAELLKRRGKLSEREVVHVVRQLLMSLGEAHELGLIHRDIKPANIRVFTYGKDRLRVKLLDFGLAKPLKSTALRLTGTGKVVGTPRFMSPEQLRGHKLTPASDIFSLGLVAAELLLGRSVVQKWDISSRRHITLDDPVSPELRTLINGMLDKQVRDRFQTTAHVLTAIESLPPLPKHVREETKPALVVETTTPTVDALPVTLEDTHEESAAAIEPPAVAEEASVTTDVIEQRQTLDERSAQTDPQSLEDGAKTEEHDAATLRRELASATNETSVDLRGVFVVAMVGAACAAAVVIARMPEAEPPPEEQSATLVEDGCSTEPAFRGLGDLRRPMTDAHFAAWVPADYQHGERHPLVLLLSEAGDNPDGLLRRSDLGVAADSHGFVVVAAPADEARRAIETARAHLCLEDELYAIAMGDAVQTLVDNRCRLNLLAFATITGRGVPAEPCATWEPAHLHVDARLDKDRSQNGACDRNFVISSGTFLREWIENYRCADRTASNSRDNWHEWTCEDGDLALWGLHGGRPWVATRTFCDGPRNTVAIGATLWSFFAQYRRTP